MSQGSTADQAEGIIANYVSLNEAYLRAKAERDEAKDKLLSLFKKEEGEQEIVSGPWVAQVTYPPKMKWDSNELAAYYGTDAPMHVKRALSIDMHDYKRLPAQERDMLAKCFTWALGTPKISVETK
jgi:hypothetical protein